MFQVRCQGCGETFDVDERRVPRNGMTMRCAKCQTSFLVKRQDAEATSSAQGAAPGAGTQAFGEAMLPMPKDLAPGLPQRRIPPRVPTAPTKGSPRIPPPPPPEATFRSIKNTTLGFSTPEGAGAHSEPGLPALVTNEVDPLHRFQQAGAHAPSFAQAPAEASVTVDEELLDEAELDEADLPQPAAGLPQAAAGLPQAAAGLPQMAVGLPQMAPSLPSAHARTADGEFLGLAQGAASDADLPQVFSALPQPAIGLPQPAAGLPQPAAGLPQPAAGLPQMAAALPQHGAPPQYLSSEFIPPSFAPQTIVGLPQPAASLPQPAASLPQPAASLPQSAAGLPQSAASSRTAAGLPQSAASLPQSAASLPQSAAGLPQSAADLPDAGPDALDTRVNTSTGMKLGRIGIERKAFAVGSDDLPRLVENPGAALPAPIAVTTGRARREQAPPRVRTTPVESILAVSPPLAAAPSPPVGMNFGEIDLGGDPLSSAGAPLPPPAAPLPPPPSPMSFEHDLPGVEPLGGAAMAFGQLDAPTFEPAVIPSFPPAPAPVEAPPPPAFDIDPLASYVPPPVSLDDPHDLGAPPPDPSFASTMGAPPAAQGRFGQFREIRPTEKQASPAASSRAWKKPALYGGLGLLAVIAIGGAALAFTEYGAFGKNWFDEQVHGPERHAAATRVILYVDRVLERDTYDRAIAGLRRLEQALSRVPQEQELKAYIVYANNLVVLRFGADATRTGRARTLLAELATAPPGMRYLSLARASDALTRGNAREAFRLAKLQTEGRDLATLSAAELPDTAQWIRTATLARQRHASPRSRYLLARAYYATGDLANARRAAEETLQSEGNHAGARVLLARLLGPTQPAPALDLLRDLVGNASTASAGERADACVVAGQIELGRDHISVAQARFQRALELDPRSSSALVGMGSILYRQGNYTDALARFRNAYSADRKNLDAVVGMAQSALALNQAADAKTALEPAVRENPDNARLHYWLGKALAATSDQRTVAQQEFREAIRLQPDSLDAYVALSELLITMQRNDAADQVLVEARARVPDNAPIHRALAHARLSRGDIAGAEAELRTALTRDADDVRAHFALGDVLRRMQRLDDASREFETVARIDPAYPGLSLARGQLAEARGELPQALTTFREALARDPTNVELINRVANTLVTLGNFGDADQMLRSVVVDHPTNAEAQYLMGRARLGLGSFTDAVHYLDRAIELNPSKAEYKAFAAEAHLRGSDIIRALALAEQSITQDPAFPRGYWVRADIRVKQGSAAQALADINRAVELDRNFWEAYATWGDIDDALGHRGEAIRLYQLATGHDSRHGDWYFNLGRLLADAGDENEARAALRQVRTLGQGLTPTPGWFIQGTRMLADLERGSSPGEARRLYLEYLRMIPPNSPAYTSVQSILVEMHTE